MRYQVPGFPDYLLDEKGQMYRKPRNWFFGKSERRVGEIKIKPHYGGYYLYVNGQKRRLKKSEYEQIMKTIKGGNVSDQ